MNPCCTCTQQHKNDFPAMEKNGKIAENVKERALQASTTWESQTWMRMGEEWNKWVNNGLGMHFQAFTFLRSQKHIFQKWVNSQIRIWPPYISHPKEITSSTTLLDDWAQKDKMGSWQFNGFSLWHLDFTLLAQGFECPPPLFLMKSCPRLFNVVVHS